MSSSEYGFHALLRLRTLAVLLLACKVFGQGPPLALAHHIAASTNGGAAPGSRVVGVGDVDGDGFDDVASGSGFAGAWVLSGKTGVAIHQLSGLQANAAFGAALDGLGDVDGDGTPDILVGAPGETLNGIPSSGGAYVFSGATGSLIHHVPSPAAGASFGYSVAGIGDVDGDTVPDFAVGAHTWGNGIVNALAGRVYVFSGNAATAIYDVQGVGQFQQFGFDVSGIGDADGDGIPDLAVGTAATNAPTLQGFYVLSGPDGALLHQLIQSPGFESLGRVVDGAGDVNGDGIADVVAGAPNAQIGGNALTGRAIIIEGGTWATYQIIDGACGSDQFGSCVGSVGDLDGDGVPELCVWSSTACQGGGIAGVTNVYSVANMSAVLLQQIQGTPAAPLGCVAGIGDTNGDGWPDIGVGGGTGLGEFVEIYSGPVLPDTARPGNVNANGAGGVLDVLGISGPGGTAPSYGYLSTRTVTHAVGQPMLIWLANPPANTSFASHVVFGIVSQALVNPEAGLPFGIGSMAFTPAALAPGPGLFTLTDTFGGETGILPSIPTLSGTPGDVVAAVPGASLGVAVTFSLQGIVTDQSAAFPHLAVTNAIRVVVQ